MKKNIIIIFIILQTIITIVLTINYIKVVKENKELNNKYTCYKVVYDDGIITSKCEKYFDDVTIKDFNNYYIPKENQENEK